MKTNLPIAACTLFLSLATLPMQQATAATTGLDFAGGCPEPETLPMTLCDMGGNADTANVAAILGVNESLVTFKGENGPGFSVTGIGMDSGTWTVTDTSITHLAFKSDGYFILGAVTAGSGDWMNDTSALGSWDLSLATCPVEICTGGARPYVDDDFTTNGGQVADLSNVRAFSVVPVPAAVWLFGSGLIGLAGIARRRKAA